MVHRPWVRVCKGLEVIAALRAGIATGAVAWEWGAQSRISSRSKLAGWQPCYRRILKKIRCLVRKRVKKGVSQAVSMTGKIRKCRMKLRPRPSRLRTGPRSRPGPGIREKQPRPRSGNRVGEAAVELMDVAPLNSTQRGEKKQILSGNDRFLSSACPRSTLYEKLRKLGSPMARCR